MRHATQRLLTRVSATVAMLLPAFVGAPGVIGTSALLSMAATGQVAAETVCFKSNTELDFINKSDMQNSRAKLENTNYFGPGGAAAPETFDFAGITTVTEATLDGAGCDIFIGGGFEGSLSTAEGAQLVNWTQGPRKTMVIGGCDLDTANQTCLAFGRTLTDIPNGGVELSQSLAYNPLTCGGADAVATFGGRSTYIGLGPAGTDVILAEHNTAGRESAVTTDDLTDPTLLMTADADMFGSSGSASIGAGPIASSNQAIFLLNVFKFALDGLKGRLDNPQCVDSYEDRTDLEIALSTPTTVVSFGDTILLDVQVANVSGFTADDIAAMVTVPAGFRLVSTTGPGTYDADTGTWTIGTMTVGQSETLQLTLEATGPGIVAFQAEISNSSLTDPDSAPNSSFDADDLADGLNDDDEATVSVTVLDVDRSDAPIGGEAIHEITAGVFLGGGLPDSDVPQQQDAFATGDDLDGNNDDDGVTIPTLIPGQPGTITVAATGAGAFLQAWIDFDGDGSFAGNEQIAADMADVDGDGILSIPVLVPVGATTGTTFARFRWSRDFSIGAAGFAGDGEVEDYAVTFGDAGTGLSGRLFLDNGTGGDTAHDGVQGGSEVGSILGTVILSETAGGTQVATGIVAADGTWTATLPPGFGGEVRVETTARPGYRSISESTGGAPGVTNPDTTDGTFTFVAAAGVAYAGLDIGFVALPVMIQDQSASVAPGQAVDLRHRYTATTSGTVGFALVDPVLNPANGFASVIFADTDCDGRADATMPASTPVTAGQEICLAVRTQAGGGVGPGASVTYGIVASTALSGTAVIETVRNDDAVRAGGSGDTMVLRKLVTNVTKASAEGVTNTADIGDVLRYRLEITNPGAAPVVSVTVSDTTPAFTALASAAPVSVQIAAGVTCTLAQPTSGGNTAGYAGSLRWECPGPVPPGVVGSLTFDVLVLP